MKTAHYFTSGKDKFVIFGENGKFTYMHPKKSVSGKKEARKLAEETGSTPGIFNHLRTRMLLWDVLNGSRKGICRT